MFTQAASPSDKDCGEKLTPPPSRKFLPKPGRVHPTGGNQLHRQGRLSKGQRAHNEAVTENGGEMFTRKGENIRNSRKSVCGLKDKMALAGSTRNRMMFINANGHIDRKLDAPVPTPVGVCTPKRRMAVKQVAACKRA